MGNSLCSATGVSPSEASQEIVLPRVETKLLDEYMALCKAQGLGFGSWGGAITSQDTLLVIDMQNDFLPADVAPLGGAFGVAEGGSTVGYICSLIRAFNQVGALVVATRDYHPLEHSSFIPQGGPFPAHCVQGSPGSKFFPAIGDALKKASDSGKGKVEIAFKGFVEEVDSFGAMKYDEAYYKEHVGHCQWQCQSTNKDQVSCAGPWTGGFCFKCANLQNDIDAPPDVMAVMYKDRRPLEKVIGKGGRMLVVGLALDYCVLDSAVNGAKIGYKAFIAAEAARAANIPGLGTFGSGFLTDPKFFTDKLKTNNITLVHVSDIK